MLDLNVGIESGGDGGQQAPGSLHQVNAGQVEQYNAMLRRLRSGSGDFGAGQNIKQGKSQLAQFMSDRGIAPGGGAGIGAYANMVGTAEAGANQNRLQYGMNLLQTPLQIAQTAGSNWLTNSPSQGYDATAQWKTYNRNNTALRNAEGDPFGGGYINQNTQGTNFRPGETMYKPPSTTPPKEWWE